MTVDHAITFSCGYIVATHNALNILTPECIDKALRRHLNCDWGEVSGEEKRNNNTAVAQGLRIKSAYRYDNDSVFWIITEADHSATTILMPEDY